MSASFVVGDTAFVVVEGLKVVLGSEFRFVARVSTMPDLLTVLHNEDPDVMLLDPDALEIGEKELGEIRRCSDGKVVLFHEAHSSAALKIATNAAVSACVPKTASLTEIREALRRAVAAPLSAAGFSKQLDRTEQHLAIASTLSHRQVEILGLVALGRTSKEIAALLRISPRTVDFHRAHIVSRLGLRQVADWTRFAIEAGLIPTDESYGNKTARARSARI